MQPVAEHRHRVRERREPEVAVERPGKTLWIAARRGQLALSLARGFDRPVAIRMALEMQVAFPSVAGRLDTQAACRESLAAGV
jgi:hypothetical protein